MTFVDSNYWLRYLIDEDSRQGHLAHQLLLDAASGKVELASSLVVFFEIYWVLHSFYHRNQAELQSLLMSVLDIDCIFWDDKDLLRQAVSHMDEFGYDLEDAYNLVWAKDQDCDDLASFDAKLQKKWRMMDRRV